MATNIVPFEQAALPAHLAALEVGNDFMSSGGGFPVISIKGKVFTIKRGGESTLITRPDSDDEPAASIEVVVLKAFPEAGKTAKAYYARGFTEGSADAPTCHSNDGVAPAEDAAEPQSDKCMSCPHAVWGSKISEEGKKLKACADVKRLAIAQVGHINDPMLLRVPADSLKALTAYGDLLQKRGVPYPAVVTKIGFNYEVAHPNLTFKPVGFVDEATMQQIIEVKDSALVAQITGQTGTPKRQDATPQKPAPKKAEPAADEAPAETPAPKAEAKPAAKPAKAAAKPAAQPAPAKPAVKSQPVVVDAEEGLDDLLETVEFDD